MAGVSRNAKTHKYAVTVDILLCAIRNIGMAQLKRAIFLTTINMTGLGATA